MERTSQTASISESSNKTTTYRTMAERRLHRGSYKDWQDVRSGISFSCYCNVSRTLFHPFPNASTAVEKGNLPHAAPAFPFRICQPIPLSGKYNERGLYVFKNGICRNVCTSTVPCEQPIRNIDVQNKKTTRNFIRIRV